MGSISESSLQKADIIVSTTSATVSKVIKGATLSNVSHARLYVGNGEVIEAVGEGVRRAKLSVAMNEDTLTVAYRRKSLDSSSADIVIRYAERQIGKPYDYGGAAGAGNTSAGGTLVRILFPALGAGLDAAAIRNMISPDDSFFCSELVARAFKEANAPIVSSSPGRTQPGDISTSHFLTYVGHLRGS
jgi:uncharacterized protein YycO